MCGIDVHLRWGKVTPVDGNNVAAAVSPFIAARGPDYAGTHSVQPTPYTALTCTSTVLNLRAEHVCHQPFILSDGSVLCYNGEIYRMADRELPGESVVCSDTQLLAQQLETIHRSDHTVTADDVCLRLSHLLQSCEGPWSVVYYDAGSCTLFWARDPMGRRSLMLETDMHSLRISSVTSSSSASAHEIVPCGIYSLSLRHLISDIDSNKIDIQQHIACRLYAHVLHALACSPVVSLPLLGRQYRDVLPYRRTPVPVNAVGSADGSDAEDDLDAMPVKAALGQRTTRKERQLQQALEREAYVPRLTNESLMSAFSQLLHEAVRVRVQTIRGIGERKQTSNHDAQLAPATVGLLFSGGLDCTVLAHLVHQYLPASEPIDLLSVAFAGDLTPAAVRRVVPDRITAIQSFEELRVLAPARQWKLIEINVTLEQMQEHRQRVQQLIKPHSTVMDFNIGCMLWFAARGSGHQYQSDCDTHSTTNASSITASDFRSQSPPCPPIETTHTSCARVLFSGLGADEQLGGYGRHRTRWRHTKANASRSQSTLREGAAEHEAMLSLAADAALSAELDRDVGRLWRRNLGRDDRCIADSGREVRHPYLDERLMAFLATVPISDICDYNMPSGGDLHQPVHNKQASTSSTPPVLPGDKQLLRQVAFQLGLRQAATLAKRALQFGSRISNRRVAGTNHFDDKIILKDVVHPQLVAPWRKSDQPQSYHDTL